jgi:uncharacterized damage-inducible protein DinB
MASGLINELYDYHRWANHRLFDVAVNLGDAVNQDMGKHWSVPTVKGMFTHLCAADMIWLARWQGTLLGRLPVDTDFPTMSELRAYWDQMEATQRAYVEGLDEAALTRRVTYRNPATGAEVSAPLGPLLQHVVNHATHHRSELATMITLISGSPPDTGIATYRITVVNG